MMLYISVSYCSTSSGIISVEASQHDTYHQIDSVPHLEIQSIFDGDEIRGGHIRFCRGHVGAWKDTSVKATL